LKDNGGRAKGYSLDTTEADTLMQGFRDPENGLLFFLNFFWGGWDSLRDFGEKNTTYDKFYEEFGAWHKYAQKELAVPTKLITSLILPRGCSKSSFFEGKGIHGMFVGFFHHISPITGQPVYDLSNYTVYITHSKEEKSTEILDNIEMMIEKPLFKRYFPWEKGPWSATKKVIIFNGRRIILQGAGSTQAFVGKNTGANRPKEMYLDDITNPDWEFSPSQQEHTESLIKMLMKKWIPSLSKKCPISGLPGRIYHGGTPFYKGCFEDVIADSKFSGIVKQIRFPILADQRTAKLLGIPYDTSIFESLHPTEQLKIQRQLYISTGREADWNSQFGMQITEKNPLTFKKDRMSIVSYKEAKELVAKHGVKRSLAISDLSYTKNKKSDSVAVIYVVFLKDEMKRVIVFRTIKKKVLFIDIPVDSCRDDFAGELVDGYAIYRSIANEYGDDTEIYLETLVFQIISRFAEEEAYKCKEKPLNFISIKDNTHKSKDARVNSVIPWCNSGKIIFVEEDNQDLFDEMENWGGKQTKKSSADDCLDCLGYIPNFMEFVEEPKKEQTFVSASSKRKSLENLDSVEIARIWIEDLKNQRTILQRGNLNYSYGRRIY
jgi:hypothetical protein